MTAAERFLSDIESFLERSGMAASAFGSAAVGDPSFVRDLRTGRMPNFRTVERVEKFIRERDGDEAAA